MTCELPHCEHRLCVCGHAECGHADENVQPNCSDCQCNGFREMQNIKPQSHQAIADEYNLNMKDPFTRCFVAALYWQECAAYWKEQANSQMVGVEAW